MDRKIGLPAFRAASNAASPHGYHSTGLAACWRRYGLFSKTSRFHFGPPATLGGLRELLVARERAWSSVSRRSWALVPHEPDGSAAAGMIDARSSAGRVELGWALGRAWWGQGLMTEAVRAVVEALARVD